VYINHRCNLFFSHFSALIFGALFSSLGNFYPCIPCAIFSSLAFSTPAFLSAFVPQIPVSHFQRPHTNMLQTAGPIDARNGWPHSALRYH